MRKIYLPADFKEKNEFWDTVWSGCSLEQMLCEVETNFMKPVFSRYFPKAGKILEAGCGLAKFVIYYRKQGYDIEGIDFAEETLKRIKEFAPSLPVKKGDLNNLDYKDGYFSAYFSGGVIEHYEDGDGSILKEARRVLKEAGLLILTVPYLNFKKQLEDIIWFTVLRREKRILMGQPDNANLYFLTAKCSQDSQISANWKFHQYAYKKSEIVKILRNHGFCPIFSKPVQVNWNLKKTLCTIGILKKGNKANKSVIFNFIKKYLLREDRGGFLGTVLTYFLGLFFANQIAIVCRKRK